MPKFSIIVGVYNQIKTLPALVDSLRNQTFKDFEVIFCDDGSDDGSQEFLADIDGRKERNELWEFPWMVAKQEHKGMRLAKNLNNGIKKARGEYCLFIMGDSFLELDYLEILREWVQPFRSICGIRIQVAEVNGKMEGVDIDWRVKKNIVPQFPAPILGVPYASLTGNGLTIPTQALREHGGWNEGVEGYGGDDNEIIARLFYKGIVFWSIPELRLYHHWHRSQETREGNWKYVSGLIDTYER